MAEMLVCPGKGVLTAKPRSQTRAPKFKPLQKTVVWTPNLEILYTQYTPGGNKVIGS